MRESIPKKRISKELLGLYPPKGMKILGWYICAGGRGVTISESEVASGESAFENYVMCEKELQFGE